MARLVRLEDGSLLHLVAVVRIMEQEVSDRLYRFAMLNASGTLIGTCIATRENLEAAFGDRHWVPALPGTSVLLREGMTYNFRRVPILGWLVCGSSRWGVGADGGEVWGPVELPDGTVIDESRTFANLLTYVNDVRQRETLLNADSPSQMAH